MAKQLRRSSIRKSGPSHRSSIWAGAIAIFILGTIATVRLAGDILYEFPANESLEVLHKDALIVCLGGGKGRIEAAFSLYASGVGKKLLIIGVGKRSTVTALLKNHAPELHISPDRINSVIVETESKNTIENAVALSQLLKQHSDGKKIILVTSGYHMRRAKFIIERIVSGGLEIIPFNPPNEIIEQQNWWHSWVGIQVTMIEFVKYIVATVIYPKVTAL